MEAAGAGLSLYTTAQCANISLMIASGYCADVIDTGIRRFRDE
jgi:hypothetical protein